MPLTDLERELRDTLSHLTNMASEVCLSLPIDSDLYTRLFREIDGAIKMLAKTNAPKISHNARDSIDWVNVADHILGTHRAFWKEEK